MQDYTLTNHDIDAACHEVETFCERANGGKKGHSPHTTGCGRDTAEISGCFWHKGDFSISVQKSDKPSVCQFFYSGRKKR